MKLSLATASACMLALTALHSAYAACGSDDPIVVAQSFFAKHAQFSSENPSKIKTIVTARFFDALEREYTCAQGDICAIEADPWTDAQDGKIGKPVEFAMVSNSGKEATVSITYPFILDKTQRGPKHASLVLRREAPTDCWLIGDLVGPRGDSLLQTIEKRHKEFGAGS
jgi:hypothetical protein